MTAPDDLKALAKWFDDWAADMRRLNGAIADPPRLEEAAKALRELASIKAGDSVVVPRVPTPDMRCKGREALPYNSEFACDDEDAERVWDAMLAAAPKEKK